MIDKRKPKKCGFCHYEFLPERPLQKACCLGCAAALGKIKTAKDLAKAEKAERAADRAKLEKFKRRADYIAEAQTAVNAYVRYRDRFKPCICCDKPFESEKPGGAMDAGHYLSRSLAPHLRFDSDRNIFGQRKNCNRPGGTTRAAFRAGVVKRIGLASVEALEADQSSPKWTIPQLIEIRDTHRAKLRALKELDREAA